MALTDKLTAIADAIRGKTGGTDGLTLDQMPAEIAGIEAGGGGADLIFETTFSVDESQLGTSEVTIATIETGFDGTKLKQGDELYMVIRCVNDTDADTSYNHIIARTQICAYMDSHYISVLTQSGMVFSDNYAQYGAKYGVYVSTGTRYFASVTVCAKGHASWGFAPAGDYSFKVYRMSKSYFGLEGVYD